MHINKNEIQNECWDVVSTFEYVDIIRVDVERQRSTNKYRLIPINTQLSVMFCEWVVRLGKVFHMIHLSQYFPYDSFV